MKLHALNLIILIRANQAPVGPFQLEANVETSPSLSLTIGGISATLSLDRRMRECRRLLIRFFIVGGFFIPILIITLLKVCMSQ